MTFSKVRIINILEDLVRQRLESISYGDFINFVIGFLQKPSLEIQIINPKMEQ